MFAETRREASADVGDRRPLRQEPNTPKRARRASSGGGADLAKAIARAQAARFGHMMIECDRLRAVFAERRDEWEKVAKS